jgi:hypothetical protein
MNKIDRNDKCPCGSGLKYKKCCLNKATQVNHSFPQKISIPTQKIQDDTSQGFYRIFRDDAVEKVNPIEYYQQHEVQKRAMMFRDLIKVKKPIFKSSLSDDYFIKYAEKNIQEIQFWEQFKNTGLHENFFKLLETTKKKDQISLLKGLSLTSEQLFELISKSYSDYGYLYSKYRFEQLPKGIEDTQKPIVSHITDDGVVKIIGETELTKGEVKNLIEQRKVIIAHFFDKGDDWHCLFTTYNSIGGKENWKDGQPHFHYISSAFGVTREQFIESMKSGQYKSTPIHIDLLGYGNQTINAQNNR